MQLAKEEVVRAYRNKQYLKPVTLAQRFAWFLMRFWPGLPHILDTLSHVEALTLPRFAAFLRHELLATAHVHALVVGNSDSDSAVRLAKEAVGKLKSAFGMSPPTPPEMPDSRQVELPRGWGTEYRMDSPNPEEVNSATVVVF